MTAVLAEPGTIERALVGRLESLAKQVINNGDKKELGRKLGLAPSGVEALLWQDNWPIERALRVAEALGVLDKNAAAAIIRDLT
jgi:hypothetical protein